MKRWQIVLLAAAVLVAAFALARALFEDRRREAVGSVARSQADALVRDHSPTLGRPDARVAIVEFLDPGCETCRVFHPLVKQLLEANPGKIKLVVRYAPLHHGADQMVAVLEAARLQGKYWETLQLMYDAQPLWADHHQPRPEVMWQFLPNVGLDMERLRRDVADPGIARLIAQDVADARALGVTKTPGFFVNGKPLVVFGWEQLRAMVEAELRASP
jgi:protein-disulfide isomerase